MSAAPIEPAGPAPRAVLRVSEPIFDEFPPELVRLPQWVGWRLEVKPNRTKPTKVPYTPAPLTMTVSGHASTIDRTTWRTLDDCQMVHASGKVDGVGFVFSSADPYCGIDLDACRDLATGALDDWAKPLVEQAIALKLYVEVSVSGTGIHIIGRGRLGKGRHVGGIELYDRERFFTMSGDRTGYPDGSVEADAQPLIEHIRATLLHDEPGIDTTDAEVHQRRDSLALAHRACALDPNAVQAWTDDFVHRAGKEARGWWFTQNVEQRSEDRQALLWRIAKDRVSHGTVGGPEQLVLEVAAVVMQSERFAAETARGKWPRLLAMEVGKAVGKVWSEHGVAPSSGTPARASGATTADKQASPATDATDADEDDLDIESLALPEFPDDALYGPLCEIVERATAVSEATRAGVAAAAVTHIAAAALQPFGVPLGDDVAGLNLFMLLVGPSAKGRKGTSSALVEKRLMPALRRLAGQAAARVEQAGHARAVADQRVAQAESVLRAAEADLARVDDPPVKRDGMKRRIGELTRNIETAAEALGKRRDELNKKFGTLRAYDNAVDAIEKAQIDVGAMVAQLAEEERVLALFDEILSNREAARARLTEAVERARYELQGAQCAFDDVPDAGVDAVLARLAEKPHRLPAISSGEGVVAAIADQTVWSDGIVFKGTEDKRLLIDLPEFGGLLANSAREGSMTSAIIRDAYDGRDLATTGKHRPMQASKPHVSVFGNITGAELVRQLFDPRDRTANADNGFANRFVMSFSRRTKLVANPQPSEGVHDLARALYRNIERVYCALRPSGETWATPIRFSPDGLREWERHYPRLTNREGSTERAKKLFGRLETNARKLAAVLAVINGEHEVGAEAVRAAVAWIEYSAATIDAVVATIEDRRKHRALLADAERVVEALRKAGTALDWRDLERATKLQRQRLRHAVAHLAGQAPPRIRVGEREATIGNGAKRKVPTLELLP